ncbi:MAG: nucleotidyl transferase AbiEii/AbiGii toxin family protein [Oscillospiraceae bacterium]
MIRTSKQVKDLVRNRSKGSSTQAQIILRNYMMERFLERVSLSKYRENFILKGGMLVSAMVGLDTRSTMDIDTTLKNLPLSIETAGTMLSEIVSVPIDDGLSFLIKGIAEIMGEADYSGLRVSLEAELDTMKIPVKIDISTGDAITPCEISYQFKLMFENRTISVLAYNLETVLAEKLETILSRGIANTRMRDFYDIYILQKERMGNIDYAVFAAAFQSTCAKRGSTVPANDGARTLAEVAADATMQQLWSRYQKKYSYAEDIGWGEMIAAAERLWDDGVSAATRETADLLP